MELRNTVFAAALLVCFIAPMPARAAYTRDNATAAGGGVRASGEMDMLRLCRIVPVEQPSSEKRPLLSVRTSDGRIIRFVSFRIYLCFGFFPDIFP